MKSNKSDLESRLVAAAGRDHVLVDEPMALHTTFKIGGPADLFLTPTTEEELAAVIRILREAAYPFTVIGNGSNLLVADRGYRGAVVSLAKVLTKIEVRGDAVFAEAGALLSQIAAAARDHSLTGFEFAGGIPGTLGGACMMNAGAYGGEMKHILKAVRYIDREGKIRTVLAKDLKLGYRISVFMIENWIVTGAEIQLALGNREEITAKMEDLTERRQTRQPLDLPSAGSTFKRPEGYFAGKLIMDSGLRGYRVGGAQISEKHCGFVVNRDHATAADVRQLMADVQRTVKEKFGVDLHPEVRFLGEF
jgi:UDP-N-acetylmuramate dehydrogenase